MKKYEAERRLLTRDYLVLRILSGFGIARNDDLAIMAGFTSHSSCRQSLAFLQKAELIKSTYWGKTKLYYLSAQGYRLVLQQSHKEYQVNSKTLHDMNVTRLATYLYLTEGVSYKDFVTDRQMFYTLDKTEGIHRPDIVLGRTCYEYERAIKDPKRLKENIAQNTKFDRQIWAIDKENARLRRNIQKASEELFLDDLSIITMEEVEQYLQTFDIKKNEIRANQILKTREFELIRRKPNTHFFEGGIGNGYH